MIAKPRSTHLYLSSGVPGGGSYEIIYIHKIIFKFSVCRFHISNPPPPLFSRYPGTICQNKLYSLYSPGILGLYARINYILCILKVFWDYILEKTISSVFFRYSWTICQNKLYPLYSPGIMGLYARINYILCILQVFWDYMLMLE